MIRICEQNQDNRRVRVSFPAQSNENLHKRIQVHWPRHKSKPVGSIRDRRLIEQVCAYQKRQDELKKDRRCAQQYDEKWMEIKDSYVDKERW